MLSETEAVVRRMVMYAAKYPRTSTVDRDIGEYQAEVEGVLLTHFHTATKSVLSIARQGKPPTRMQVERFKKFFDVPEWALVERPPHPLYGVVRLRWNRAAEVMTSLPDGGIIDEEV